MYYLPAFSPSGIEAFRVEELIEADGLIEAEQEAISKLNEQDQQDYWEGRAQLKLYMMGSDFSEEHDVVTGEDISIAHQEAVEASLASMGMGEDDDPDPIGEDQL